MSRVQRVGEYLVRYMPSVLEELHDKLIPSFPSRVARDGRKAGDPAAFVRAIERSLLEQVTMFFHDIVMAVDRKVCVLVNIDFASEDILLELQDNIDEPGVVLIDAPEIVAPVKAAITKVARHHMARAANINT